MYRPAAFWKSGIDTSPSPPSTIKGWRQLQGRERGSWEFRKGKVERNSSLIPKIYGKKCPGRAGRLNGGKSTPKFTLRGKISFTIIYKWIEWVSEKGLPRTHLWIFAFCLLHVNKCYKLIFVNYKPLNITLWKDYLSYALTSLWSVGRIPRNYYREFSNDGADHSFLYIYI